MGDINNSQDSINEGYSLSAIEKAAEIFLLQNFELDNKKILDAEWFNYARSYLQSAKLLLQNINSNELLIIPAFFNLKHGIELTIKTVYKLCNLDFKNNHNIKELYGRIQEKIDNLTLAQSELKKLVTRLHLEIDENKIKTSNKFICDHFRRLVTKYYYQIPFSKTFTGKSFIIQDSYNEIFRYPETNKVKLAFRNTNNQLGNKISIKERKEIIEDIDIILLFLALIYLIQAK